MKQLLIVFTILLVASVSAQPGCVSGNTGQITLLASDPIAFYPLNELEQASMYCYNTRGGCPTGTYINNPLLGQSGVHPPPNAQDASVYFNPSLLGLLNVGQYAIIPADPIFNTPSFTVEIWNKPEVEQLLTAAPLVGSLASPATGGMQIVLTTQLFYRCDIALVNGNIFSISSPVSLHLSILKMWSHVACTYDAATFELTLIVDGENLVSATAPAAFLPTDGPFLIARLPDLSTIEYPGNLDELAFYDRAVPDRELKEHWSDVFVYKFIVDGFDPVGFYRFETLDPLNPILFNWGTGGSALDMATIVNLGGVPLITGALPGIDFFYTNNGLTSALLAPVSQFFTGGFRSGLNTRDFTIIVYADPIISNLITGAVILDSSDTVPIVGTRLRGYRFEYNNANQYVASIVTSDGIRTVRHAPGLQQTHIAVTYNDTTGYFAMYSDGIEVDSIYIDPGTYMPATGSRTTLAGSDSGLISSFTGFLDEIQYYDVSLTPQNIQDIYNAGVEQCTAPGTCPASTICVPYGAACFDCITVTSQIINGVDITANGQADREQTDATWDLVHTGITTNDYIAYMEPGDDPNDPSDPATLYGVQQYNPGNNNIVDFTQVDPTVDMLQVVTRLASAPELGWIPWDVFVTLIIDTDKDGIPNDTDLDIDNDGIPNTQEGAGDTDGDGIPDVEDLDSDNDGIPDIIEAGGQDTDGNGRVDSFVDVNGDGYDDILAMNPLSIPNSDSDAYSNVVDRDSDNDGIPDLVEMGDPDVDNNGAVDNMVDANNNGWDDAHEGIRTMPDVDSDGFSNYIDRDSDGDGIFDITEAGPPFATNDNNNDGIVDGFTANAFGMHTGFQGTPLPIPDSDGDGVKDFVDLDSDNDLINDAIESGGVDLNGDGIHDAIMGDTNNDGIDDGLVGTLRDRDTDSDGIPDRIDIDSENDGVSDLMEQTGSDPNGNGRVSPFVDSNGDGLHDGALGTVAADQDGDGVPNYRDLDSDNDGVTDIREANSGVDADANGILDTVVDANNDGLHDPIDTSLAPDTDGDGLRDFLDADSDNDTIPDTIESGIADTNFDGRMDVLTGDFNNNGLDDALEGVSLAPVDSDNDSIPDRIDVDSDNDGITDLREQLYDDVAGNGMLTITDLNNDGLHDPASGVGPIDTDNDMVRNNLDLDSDNDGLPDLLEGQISAPSANGAVISPLTDVNGDGLHDSVLGSTLPDTDGDFIPDFVDADSDGDGTPDVVEAGGFDSDLNAVIDGFIDVNGDGLHDDILTTPLSNGDNDNDGVPDVLDIDSDNDGIPDSVEVFGISADLDKDGQIDDTTDINGNGLSDAVESSDRSRDTDGDLIQDKFDLDSDNDGIPDVLEAGGQDANGDGRVDSILPDANGNGMADALETTPLPILDRDADGALDFIDLDTDGDGIPDVIEGGSPDVDNNGMIDPTADLNNNGLDDSRENTLLVLPNSDNDATPDFADLDSDNDSYSDLAEAGFYTVAVVDSSDDGIIDGSVDADNDGILDSVDSDPNNFGSATPTTQLANIDGDSLPDYIDPRNNLTGQLDIDRANNGVDSPLDADNDGMIDSPVDADSDGIADNIDILLGTFGGIPFPRDTDGDTITDVFDGDSDNDGILDVVEGNNDTDGDGIPDFLDLDSDGDGIPDIVEAGLPDVDGDGKVDMFVDVNGDGVDDIIALSPVTPPDTDNDGIPDYQDLDSDNDGAYDVAESQIPDLDNDGKADGDDSNHDGLVDGLPNHTVDTDNDGVIDRLDHDSDNDGIPDVIENGNADTDNDNQIDNFTDANNDGYDDNLVPGAPLDSDNDGVSDYIDLDSDNDGLFDIAEAGGVDTNNDGLVDNFTDGNGDGLTDDLFGNPLPIRDSDGDGFLDTQDLDADNDGISDNIENGLFTDTDGNGIANGGIDANGVPVGATSVLADTDNDGVANFQDLDTDNDGIFDIIENGGVDVNMDGMVDSFMDNNSNGFHDPIEGTQVVLADSDSDGVPNLQDLDGDNDGIYDVVESGLTDTDSDGMVDAFVDTNLDGVHDDLNATPRPVIDTDNDGVYDALDLDSDNDGISDHLENGLNTDTDGDGRVDEPVGPNGAAPSVVSNVFDSDNDGVRDMLDLDSDNDGIPDIVEAGITDSNGDGEVDNFTDLNGNGFHDGAEGQLLVNPDLDGDGVANTRDLDSDNDAITDVVEAGGQDTNGDGMVDNYSDSVFPNGWNDRTELTPLPFPDTDGDGAYDLYDLDTDNDGIPDVVEVGFQHPGNWMYPIGVDTNQNGRADDLELIGFINLDTDNDGVGNDKDLDSDNDAVSDLRENGDNIDADTLDADNNGVLDGIDSDGDGIVDSVDNFVGFGNNAPTNTGTGFISIDSDGDGIFDIDVYRPDLADSRVDLNNDGIIDGNFDSDGDGIIDLVDEAIGFFGGLSFPSPSVPSPPASPSVAPASPSTAPSAPSASAAVPSSSPLPVASASSAPGSPSRTPDAQPSSSSAPSASSNPLSPHSSTPLPIPTMVNDQTSNSAEIEVSLPCKGSICTEEEIEIFIQQTITFLNIEEDSLAIVSLQGNVLTFIVCDSLNIPSYVNSINDQQFSNNFTSFSRARVLSVVYDVPCENYLFDDNYLETKSSAPIVAMSILVHALLAILIL